MSKDDKSHLPNANVKPTNIIKLGALINSDDLHSKADRKLVSDLLHRQCYLHNIQPADKITGRLSSNLK